MKKLIHILLLLIYLIPTIGITLSYHYCGEYIQSVNLNFSGKSKEPDDCCAENNSVECCKTEVKNLKLSLDLTNKLKIELADLLLTKIFIIKEIEKQSTNSFNYFTLKPKFPPGKFISLQNHSILI